MGMFTSGAYDSFKNRQQEHRKNRAGARKDYNDWLTSQRDAGIDVTSEMATNQFANIADNDYNIMTGAPTKMEMGAQLSANNTAARDIRASNQAEAFDVTDNLNSRYEKELKKAYLSSNDAVDARKKASDVFSASPDMAAGFSNFLNSIPDSETHRKDFLSGHMMTPEVQNQLTDLADRGITDIGAVNPSLPQYIKDAFNQTLVLKSTDKMNSKAKKIYSDLTASGFSVSAEDLNAAFQAEGISPEITKLYSGERVSQYNTNLANNSAKSRITTMLTSTQKIEEATFKAMIKDADDATKTELETMYNSHNNRIQVLSDKAESAAIKSNLTLKNENIAVIMADHTATPQTRVQRIMKSLGYDPTSDKIVLESVQDFVMNSVDAKAIVGANAYETALTTQRQAAIGQIAEIQKDGDAVISGITAPMINEKGMNPTQISLLNQIAAGLEPYYLAADDKTAIANVKQMIKQDVSEGGRTAEEIILRVSQFMQTDQGIESALTNRANFTSGPMPVKRFMDSLNSYSAKLLEQGDQIIEFGDKALTIDPTNILDLSGIFTVDGERVLTELPQAIAALTMSINDVNDQIKDIEQTFSNKGLFSNSYKLGENLADKNQILIKYNAFVNRATIILTTLNKYTEIAEKKRNEKPVGPASKGTGFYWKNGVKIAI